MYLLAAVVDALLGRLALLAEGRLLRLLYLLLGLAAETSELLLGDVMTTRLCAVVETAVLTAVDLTLLAADDDDHALTEEAWLLRNLARLLRAHAGLTLFAE